MRKILSVTEFNTTLKEIVRELGTFKIRGEITEMTITSRKGVYLTLSDGKSNLQVSGYAPIIQGIDMIEKGMSVVIEGVSDFYVPYGKFSLSAKSIEPEGEGALAIAYEKLKKKLESEGFFDDAHKQELPKYITKIALFTGIDSAAYSDFTKILKENRVGVDVDYYPVIVQGENSVSSILGALNQAKENEYDLLILTRGGGSLEDLKSFNDEEIAKAIFLSTTPIIVGVGHEKDESIADFVADIRASTPSQAAYYIQKQNQDFLDELYQVSDYFYEQLMTEIRERKNYIDNGIMKIENKLDSFVEKFKLKINTAERLIKSYDIKSTLNRGFVIVEKEKKAVKSAKKLKEGDEVKLIFGDGERNSIIL